MIMNALNDQGHLGADEGHSGDTGPEHRSTTTMSWDKWFQDGVPEYAENEKARIDALIERLSNGNGRGWARWLEWLVRGTLSRVRIRSPLTTQGVWITELHEFDAKRLDTLPGSTEAAATKLWLSEALNETTEALKRSFGHEVDIDAREPLARNEQTLRCLIAITDGDKRRIVFAASEAAGDPLQGWRMMEQAANRIAPRGTGERKRTSNGRREEQPLGVGRDEKRRMVRLAEQGRRDAIRKLDRETRGGVLRTG